MSDAPKEENGHQDDFDAAYEEFIDADERLTTAPMTLIKRLKKQPKHRKTTPRNRTVEQKAVRLRQKVKQARKRKQTQPTSPSRKKTLKNSNRS